MAIPQVSNSMVKFTNSCPTTKSHSECSWNNRYTPAAANLMTDAKFLPKLPLAIWVHNIQAKTYEANNSLIFLVSTDMHFRYLFVYPALFFFCFLFVFFGVQVHNNQFVVAATLSTIPSGLICGSNTQFSSIVFVKSNSFLLNLLKVFIDFQGLHVN